MSIDQEEIAKQAEEDFDFGEALQGKRKLRDRTVTVYLDEVAGEALGGTEETKQNGIVVDVRRWGVLGKIDELRENNTDSVNDEEILGLLDEAEELLETLKESALVVKLHGVPDIILKDTRRRARKTFSIKSKGIPEDLEEAYILRQGAELLSDCLVSTTFADGRKKTKFTVEDAEKMKAEFPPSEYLKIDVALMELQYQSAIASSVTDNPDF